MEKEFPAVPDAQRTLEDNARRYQQLLDHPRDAHHLFALLLAHKQNNVAGKAYLNAILDQLHLQDLAKAGQLATNRAWQAGAVDGRSGSEIAADKMIAANMAIVDADRQRRAAAKGAVYIGDVGYTNPVIAVEKIAASIELRTLGGNPGAEGQS